MQGNERLKIQAPNVTKGIKERRKKQGGAGRLSLIYDPEDEFRIGLGL